MLVLRATGEPLSDPSLYVLSEIRATNRARNTIDHILRSIMVLQLFLDLNRIDLKSRLRDGHIFSLSELDELVRYCRRPVSEQLKVEVPSNSNSPLRIGSAEVVRSGQRLRAPAEVAGHTAANRVRTIRD